MAITINGNGTITGYDPVANGSITSAKLADGAATQAKRTYATGEIIQIKTDSRSGNAVDVTSTKQTPFGADLEVSITFSSTSNLCYVSCFIPDVYNFAAAGVSMHAGFSHSTDNFSSNQVSIGSDNLSTHINYHGSNDAFLEPTSYDTSVSCPTTSTIKIRPHFSPNNGSVRLSANNAGVAHLTVMEIQG